MPLTNTESRILSLWDSGSHAREIARVSGIPHTRVAQVIETYHDRGTRQHRLQMAESSARLRDAILAQFRPMPSSSPTLVWNGRTLADAQQGAVA